MVGSVGKLRLLGGTMVGAVGKPRLQWDFWESSTLSVYQQR